MVPHARELMLHASLSCSCYACVQKPTSRARATVSTRRTQLPPWALQVILHTIVRQQRAVSVQGPMSFQVQGVWLSTWLPGPGLVGVPPRSLAWFPVLGESLLQRLCSSRARCRKHHSANSQQSAESQRDSAWTVSNVALCWFCV